MEALLKLVIAVVVIFLLLLITAKLLAVYKAKRLKGKKLEEFGKGKLLVYFFSPKCGACITMERELERAKGIRVKRIDLSDRENLLLAKKLGIMATPTTLFVEKGVIKEVLIGIQKAERLEKLFHDRA